MFKIAAAPGGLARSDAAVAYLAGPGQLSLRDRIAGAVGDLVSGNPPPLTDVLGDGVGWAEDPGSGASFGETRCQTVAAAHAGLPGGGRVHLSAAEWLEAVASEMVRRGLDPAAPHLAARDVAVAR